MGTGPSQSTAARNNLDRTPASFLSTTLLLLLLPAPSNASRWWTFDFAFAKICLFIAFPDPLEQSQPRAINGNFSSEVMRLISSCRIVSNILLDWRSGQVSGSCDPEFQYDFNRCQLPRCRQGNSLPNFGWYKKKKKNWVSNQMGTWGCVCECVSMCMRVNVCVSFSLKTMPHVSPALGQSCWREGRLHSGAGSWSSPLSLDIAWEAWGATEASLSRLSYLTRTTAELTKGTGRLVPAGCPVPRRLDKSFSPQFDQRLRGFLFIGGKKSVVAWPPHLPSI